jgi:hypothetical protein
MFYLRKSCNGKFCLVLCSRQIHKRLISRTTSQDGATAVITRTQTTHFNLQLLFQSIFNLVNNLKTSEALKAKWNATLMQRRYGAEFGVNHLLSHPFTHFAKNSVRHVVCAKGKPPLLQNVWTDLEYQLDMYTVTNNVQYLSDKIPCQL